jgi:anti-anti-sigma factor
MDTTAHVFDIEHEGDALVITPLADLREVDSERVAGAMRGLLELVSSGAAKNVVFDFRRTDYYGSSALSFFVKLWKRVRRQGGELAFCGLSDHEREILAVTNLDQIWPVCRTREEALAAAGAGGLAVPASGP